MGAPKRAQGTANMVKKVLVFFLAGKIIFSLQPESF